MTICKPADFKFASRSRSHKISNAIAVARDLREYNMNATMAESFKGTMPGKTRAAQLDVNAFHRTCGKGGKHVGW